jgi:ABC-type phosphate transport system permease subunit
MTAAMAALGFGSDQVAGDDLAFQSLYFIGILLFFMTFLLNLFSDFLVRRVREEY